LAADWPQWRGPGRDARAPESPPLIEKFPQGGPKLLWKNAKVPSAGEGGYGSVVVADGFAYVYANTKHYEPFDQRTLTTRELENLGYHVDMPDDLRAKLEAARTSEERAKLKGDEERNWVAEWVKANLPQDQQKLRGFCFNRLRQGAQGIPVEALAKLAEIRDKALPTQKDLDAWFEQSGIDAKWKKNIYAVIPTRKNLARDEVFCLRAENGEVAWKRELPGAYAGHSSSSTPCVAGGRVFVQGSMGEVHCLNARSGEVVWTAKTKAQPGRTLGSSFLVRDNLAAVLSGSLVGLDAAKGDVLWTADGVRGGDCGSPVFWSKEGAAFVICNGSQTYAVNAADGKPAWQAPGGGNSTPVISGDHMVVFSGSKSIGLVAYALDPKEPKKLWSVPWEDRGSSPVIHDGYVYAFGGRDKGRAVCVELATGRIAWDEKLPPTEIQSPVFADGKLWIAVGSGGDMALYVIRATPDKYELLDKTKMPIALCVMPAIADGRLYVRLNDGVACYDLRK
jgi:outer membrane protein assembly factor BamB